MRLSIGFCTLWLTWLALVNASNLENKVVCYFGSWAIYRTGNGKIEVSDIDPKLCTHMIYSFVGINADGTVHILDPWCDLTDNGGKGGFQKFNALRKESTDTKTLVAIGGWNEGSARYSAVMADPQLRSNFVQNVVDFTIQYEFDGFDLDWEYPNQRGGAPADLANYVLLVKELRTAFDQHGLILSAAVGAAEGTASLSYDIPQIAKYLDFINIMTYDFHGAWDSTTGFNAPLYAAARDTTTAARSLNVNATVHYWLNQGAPAEKLVLGVGLYGRTFTLSNSDQNVPGSPVSGAGQAGPYTMQSGMLGYNEICGLQAEGSWTTVWDAEQRVPYAYSGNQWVGFDNVASVTEKAQYAKAMGLGGAMVWSLESDDFRGTCGEPFPLLTALNRVLREDAGSGSDSVTDAVTSTKTVDHTIASLGSKAITIPESVGTVEDDQESNIICSGSQYVRDSQDCAKFWMCQQVNENDFKAVSFTCSEGLYFDTDYDTCNFERLVKC